MTTTTAKGYTLPTVGADFGVWGGEINGDFSIIDNNLGGEYAPSVAGNTNFTVSSANAQKLIQVATGALTGDIHYILPSSGFWIAFNGCSGAHTLSFASAGGGGAVVPVTAGTGTLIWSDGANMFGSTDQTRVNALIVAILQGNVAIGGTLSVAGGATTNALTTNGQIAANAGVLVANGNVLLSNGFIETFGATGLFESGYEYGGAGVFPLADNRNYGVIVGSGVNALANAFDAYSDSRLKSDIATITPDKGREFIDAAKPSTYWKSGHYESGFVAQDMIRAGYTHLISAYEHPGLPELKEGDLVSKKDIALMMNYDQTIAYVTAAMKGAFAQIDELKAQVKALEAR